jgi:hypothetical protein
MDLAMKIAIVFAMLATTGCAHEREPAASALAFADLPALMGGDVRIQPVFAGAGVKGWRLYGIRTSPPLKDHAINEGSLLTHVCGVPANEIHARVGNIPCKADVSRQVELTFALPDGERAVLLPRR